MNTPVVAQKGQFEGSAVLPDWRDLLPHGFDARSVLASTAERSLAGIGARNEVLFKSQLLERLAGRQPLGYARMLRASKFTDNPERELLLKACLLFEIEHLDMLRNERGNRFRDSVTKTLIEISGLDDFESQKRIYNDSSLVRTTLRKVIRSRIDALPLGEIKEWLLKSHLATREDYNYRRLLHIAKIREPRDPEIARGILGDAAAALFSWDRECAPLRRVYGLMCCNPLVVDDAVKEVVAFGSHSELNCLRRDLASFRLLFREENSISKAVAKWLTTVPFLEGYWRKSRGED